MGWYNLNLNLKELMMKEGGQYNLYQWRILAESFFDSGFGGSWRLGWLLRESDGQNGFVDNGRQISLLSFVYGLVLRVDYGEDGLIKRIVAGVKQAGLNDKKDGFDALSLRFDYGCCFMASKVRLNEEGMMTGIVGQALQFGSGEAPHIQGCELSLERTELTVEAGLNLVSMGLSLRGFFPRDWQLAVEVLNGGPDYKLAVRQLRRAREVFKVGA